MLSYYLALALASMRRTPVLSSLMVLALGLGIGAFMTTFTVYYLMSGDPIPHKSDVLFAVQLDNWDPNSPPTESAEDVQPQLTWQDGLNLISRCSTCPSCTAAPGTAVRTRSAPAWP
jgi:putative ABC transport system permease protein